MLGRRAGDAGKIGTSGKLRKQGQLGHSDRQSNHAQLLVIHSTSSLFRNEVTVKAQAPLPV